MTTVFEASEKYLEAGIPLVVLAGKEYGSGSSRDWAAKGTALLGVKAVIAESYERIHRSNLIGMGVLPLQYPEGENAESLGPHRRGDVLHHRRRPSSTTARPRGRSRSRPATRSSTPSSGSTPRARRTTTATAASCSTSCAACSRAEGRLLGLGRPGADRGGRWRARGRAPPSRAWSASGLGLVAAPVDQPGRRRS